MVLDEGTNEILVIRDPFRSRIEVHLKGETPDSYAMGRLTPLEARRLAAILLFQAGKLDRATGDRSDLPERPRPSLRAIR
ncbi:MAG TPA: hypothetical protein VGS03_09670 [Candidatus Polarisedimenticolia bacterium]|jgi:hypothetical protein|nr:hypothetical protein [Candidatus Polarisedimenticolia bacterium]